MRTVTSLEGLTKLSTSAPRTASMHDVIIVGAGPVGASLAIALAEADLDVLVVDARAPHESLRGDRSLALSHGARLIFERLGVWGDLVARGAPVTPIVEIDISQAGGFGQARLRARDQGLPALGYVVSYRALQAALDDALRRTGTRLRYGIAAERAGGTHAYAAVLPTGGGEPLLARLVVVADGGGVAVAGIARQRYDYRQSALVARVSCRMPHHGVAFERFTPDGPVALLPEQDDYGLVWTARPGEIARLSALPDALLLDRLRARFGPRLSDFVAVRDRRIFPLALELASSVVSTRCAVIGNAAQALHPIGGQGFNLGLRDAFELARVLVDTPVSAIGERAMLARYARARRLDRYGGLAFTNGLLAAFGAAPPWLRWPRGLALSLLDAAPPFKRAFARTVLFGLH